VAIYIFDLDGTLADATHRLHFIAPDRKGGADWSKFFKACVDDKPILPVIDLLKALVQAGHTAIISTGRSDEVRSETWDWIIHHNIPVHKLFMRKAGDHRPDHIVKMELLDEISLRREIVGIFEDRQAVVDEYRKRGLTVYQVAYGGF
jgi:phosphoglycolate phosphatase-like HAD superfamily hydrolase